MNPPDAIATLDREEQDVPGRSRRLTANRRKTIFLTFVPCLFWWIPYQLVGLYGAWNSSLAMSFALGTVDHLVLLVLDLVMVQYYLDIFKNRAPAPAPAAATASTEPPVLLS